MTDKVPTLAEWAGGPERFKTLFETFYARAPNDPVLAPVFADMDPHHARHVAAFVGYLEWGTRLAVINSAEGVPEPDGEPPMPVWGWGPPGGPWLG